MKRTNAMKYNETVESRELMLCLVNESLLYPQVKAVVNQLHKKLQKGTFDKERAVDAFYPVVTNMAKLYCQRHGSWNDKYYTMFDVQCRFTVAVECVEYYADDIETGL